MVEDHNYRQHPPFLGDMRIVDGRLQTYEFDGWWDYEEACKRVYVVGPINDPTSKVVIKLGDK